MQTIGWLFQNHSRTIDKFMSSISVSLGTLLSHLQLLRNARGNFALISRKAYEFYQEFATHFGKILRCRHDHMIGLYP